MRYIKRKTHATQDLALKYWEQVILEEMNLKTFFVCKQTRDIIEEVLCYMSDEAFFDSFNEEYKSTYSMVELSQDEVRKIIESKNIGFTCSFDSSGKVLIKENKDLINQMRKKDNPKVKPYNSWIWNSLINKWQAPQPHPIEYQGKFVFIKSLDKVVQNPNYNKYRWNEEISQWEKIEQTDDLIYLEDEYMWEFSSNLN